MGAQPVTDDAVAAWLTWLATAKGSSRNTITTYRSIIGTLPDPLHATREDVEAWWKKRAVDGDGNPRPHSSRNVELATLRSFYKYALRFDLRDDDPTRRLDNLREQRRESRFVGQEELRHLLTHLDAPMRRAVALGAYGGLRVSEAASVNWRDVNLETRRMIVRGKGDKERQVGVSTVLLDQILPDTGGNIVTGTNEAYDGHYLQQKVNAAMRRNGASLTFHALRHRYGYMAAAANMPITSIARAMGHSGITTTQRYIAATGSDLDLIAEAVSR